MVFPVVRYGYESWTIMKADHQRIDGFKLWGWIRLLRVPGAARRSNQSILKEINPDIVSPWVWGIEEGLFRPFLSQLLVLGERFKPEMMERFTLLARFKLGPTGYRR